MSEIVAVDNYNTEERILLRAQREKQIDEVLTPELAEEINKYCNNYNKNEERIRTKIQCYLAINTFTGSDIETDAKTLTVEVFIEDFKKLNNEYDNNNNNTKIN